MKDKSKNYLQGNLLIKAGKHFHYEVKMVEMFQVKLSLT